MAVRAARTTTESLRDRVVREAAALIAQRGFEAVSVADVAAASGLSKQALMYHFKTKEALKHAVLDQLLTHANRTFLGLMSSLGEGQSQRLDRTLVSLQSWFDEEPDAARVMLRFILDGDEDALERIREGALPWFGVLATEIREGQRTGRIRKGLDPEAAVAQVGMLVLTNFALLPVGGWSNDTPANWRKRRLVELLRSIRSMLFTEPPPATPKSRKRSGA